MKARLPFLVDCTRVEPGKRAYQRGYVAFEDTFDVNVIDERDTAIAARLVHAGVTEQLYRLHEGRFYRPASDRWYDSEDKNNRNFPSDIDGLEIAALLVNGGGPIKQGEWLYEFSRLLGVERQIKSHEVVKFSDADQEIERRRELARKAYEDMTIIIDGMAWMQIDEPHLIVSRPQRGFTDDQVEFEIVVSERRPVPVERGGVFRQFPYEPPQLCPTFRLDRLDEMVDFIHEARQQEGLETKLKVPELQVLRPEFFVYDDETDNMVRSADEILTMTQPELRGATKTFVNAWHNVDVAVAKGLQTLEASTADDIEAGLGLIAAMTTNEKARRVASRALQRFSLRSIGPSYR